MEILTNKGSLILLFNSFLYILLFLPLTFTTYFLLSKHVNFTTAKVFLVLASFFFYAWWNPFYLPLLLLSTVVNYSIAYIIQKNHQNQFRKPHLIIGIIFNLGLLGYFKYANFFVDNINVILHSSFTLKEIILPLGISFFTFTQIAFLVDVYKSKAENYGLLNYCLFVSYFPHLLAGPIIHHAQMMPQFANKENALINYKNIYFGLILFIIGLTKKVAIADTFAIFANDGYTHVDNLNFTTAWITSLAYTFQIYFDFSGYTDMAIGASKLFNIDLPINFNSPYQSLNIREFWHRWHITLSQFLRDYLYIPLGGNRVSESKMYRNLVLTFVLGGFWHGAGWTFILWGLCHGTALSIERWIGKFNIQLPKWLAWFITFNFINITWIFFRADSIQQALQILTNMINILDVTRVNLFVILLFLSGMYISLKIPNSYQIIEKPITARLVYLPIVATFMLLSIILMEIGNSHEFIYFRF